MERIAIIGAGAWGTALATVARRAGREVAIWAREAEVADAINRTHENTMFLPGVALDAEIRAVTDMAKVVDHTELVLLVTPAQHLRAVAESLAPHMKPGLPAVICAKGIERGSHALMSEVVAAALPDTPCAVLSGPTFAAEVARGLPAAVTLAAGDGDLGLRLVASLGGAYFRPYLSDDLIGAQIGGAVKNVLAIACGIVGGAGLGENARAALITRGLAEMVRLGLAKGARAETLMGLSGLGDLTLTCNGAQSRNMSLGQALGRGEALADIVAGRRSVAEGVATSASVMELAASLGVEMPISQAVNAILHDGASVAGEIEKLLARPFRAEPAAP